MGDKIEDGGPAFPRSGLGDRGMSLRDWFAGQALVGEIARHSTAEAMNATAREARDRGMSLPEYMAKNVYLIADAMLRARKVSHG